MIFSKPFRVLLSKELKIWKNRFSTDSVKLSGRKQKKEVKVPCPWGHISGVWWGREDVQPVLAIHGWLDNSGSWTRLAQNLDKDISLLAIDLPGTGQSSHLPPFYNYHFSSSSAILRRIQQHFNFKDLIVFGHSGGSATAFLFSCLYPDLVKGYLGVDYIFYSYKREDVRANITGEVLDEFLNLTLKDTNSKSYDWEEAKQTWIRGSLLGSTNPELIEDLMDRGVNQLGDKYSFSRDIRLRHLKATAVDCFSVDQAITLAQSINCHICLIKAIHSPFFDMGIRNSPSIVDILCESSRSFHLHEIEGNHHVHMEHPDEVARITNSFLKSIT